MTYDNTENLDPDRFVFRGFHPQIFIGTASDRYAGWIGQIYTEGLYKLSSRSHKVGDKLFKEETLPIESVAEYFQHFGVLEIDFTFYRPLVDRRFKPSSNYKILENYHKYLTSDNRLILKVPQEIFARKFWRNGKQLENPNYLNPGMFSDQFYGPANSILGDNLAAFIFEQEYQRKVDRILPEEYTEDLDKFLGSLPEDSRYHIETRTEFYHTRPYFAVLAKYGVGQVLSHWTWLPSLLKQFAKAGNRFYNQRDCIIRLMTPIGMRYQDAYAKAHPFDKLVDGMLQPEMVTETAELMKVATEKGVRANVIVNNRAGGNAPLIARKIVEHFS